MVHVRSSEAARVELTFRAPLPCELPENAVPRGGYMNPTGSVCCLIWSLVLRTRPPRSEPRPSRPMVARKCSPDRG
jgi:hypothetical protein